MRTPSEEGRGRLLVVLRQLAAPDEVITILGARFNPQVVPYVTLIKSPSLLGRQHEAPGAELKNVDLRIIFTACACTGAPRRPSSAALLRDHASRGYDGH